MSEHKLYMHDDIGPRLEHLMDLHNVWSFGLSLLERPGYHTDLEKQHAEMLRVAIKMLNYRLEEEYSPTPYAKVINSLPKEAKEIKDDIKIDPDDFTTHRDDTV